MSSNTNRNSCARFQAVLDSYLDGELEAKALRVFELHRKECADCAIELRNAEVLQVELRALPQRRLPETFEGELFAATSRRHGVLSSAWASLGKPFRRLISSVQPRPVLAGVAIIAVTVVLALSLRQAEEAKYSASELALAEKEARIALAYFSHVTRKASETLLQQTIGEVMGEVIGAQVLVPVTDAIKRPMQEENR